MSLLALQKDPLTACAFARESEDGLYQIEFEGASMASSWSVRFYRRMKLRKKEAGGAGDLELVEELDNYAIGRKGPRVTVRYLPAAPGIVRAGEAE